MMEVAILCRFLDLNPFDQPAVENVKITTKKMLSKNVWDKEIESGGY